jgi:adenosine deaminase
MTIHAGEAFGPALIQEALHECGANRIGRGIASNEDAADDLPIRVDIWLTSNVQTRVSPSFEHHPIRTFFDGGLVTTLNTDNRLMSDTTVTEEYWSAHRHLGVRRG